MSLAGGFRIDLDGLGTHKREVSPSSTCWLDFASVDCMACVSVFDLRPCHIATIAGQVSENRIFRRPLRPLRVRQPA